MNLVIGNTSQLSHYFPSDYTKISSRNIDLEYLKGQKWNAVYITFAEQRIYDVNIDYITPNYIYTLQLIKELLPISNKIVCYTSAELWSNLNEKISLTTQPSFNLNNEYTISKLLLLNKIKELRKINKDYDRVIFIHPFYFNSIYRSEYFLFGKIFKSIMNKEKITVGNLDFVRDIVHTKYIVEKSIKATSDQVVGAGQLFNIKRFIQDLYYYSNMDFNSYVTETELNKAQSYKLICANSDMQYKYKNLLDDTLEDIKKGKR